MHISYLRCISNVNATTSINNYIDCEGTTSIILLLMYMSVVCMSLIIDNYSVYLFRTLNI